MYVVLICTFVCMLVWIYLLTEDGLNAPVLAAVVLMGSGALAGALIASVLQCFLVPTVTLQHQPVELVAVQASDALDTSHIRGAIPALGADRSHLGIRSLDGSISPVPVSAGTPVRIIEDSALGHKGLWVLTTYVTDTASPWFPWVGIVCRVKVVKHEFSVPVGKSVYIVVQ